MALHTWEKKGEGRVIYLLCVLSAKKNITQGGTQQSLSLCVRKREHVCVPRFGSAVS